MKALLVLVNSPQHEVVIAVIKVLAKIMRSEAMKQTWLNFLELLLLKIIDCYKISKEVSSCAAVSQSKMIDNDILCRLPEKLISFCRE